MFVVGIVFLVLGLWFLLTAVLNVVHMRSARPDVLATDGPLISVCVPARNEEGNIGACVGSLARQSYKNLEILVLDDNSTDRTAEIVDGLARKDPRIRCVKGEPLPPGWKGKTFAMAQLEKESRGEWLLFTDADTVHHPDSVANGYSTALAKGADFVSGYPRERAGTCAGRLAVSSMVLPLLAVPYYLGEKIRSEALASCIGQYMLMRRDALAEAGGFESIKNKITDDVGIVRRMVGLGRRTLMVSFKEHVDCDMYKDFKSAVVGMGRSVAGIFPTWMFSFLLAAVAALLGLAASWLLSLLGLVLLGFSKGLAMVFAGATLIRLAWFVAARYEGFGFLVSLSQPEAFVIIVVVYCYGVFKRLFGGKITWKGREV